MSDKHTAAQGSTYECGTGDVQRLPDRVVDALIDGAGVSRCAPGQGIYVIDQTKAVEKLVHDTCEELLARLPSPRATEGQAQTSVATCTGCNGDGSYEHKGAERECRVCGGSGNAAQLADSTAPGEPVEQAANALIKYNECMEDGEEPDALERLRFFCSFALKGQDWLDSEKFFDDVVAQQSLTAGGAVPEDIMRLGYAAPDYGSENEQMAHRSGWIDCHQQVIAMIAASAGWWSNDATNQNNPLCFSNKIALVHSEVSEALEGDRKNAMDEHLPHRPAREVELADALIRILDLGGAYKLDLAGALVEKMAYNARRADHKPEARAAAGGKVY